MSRVAFIGLGNMGRPMVANLLTAGHQLTVFDLLPGALDEARAGGATVAADAASAVADVEVVISMLPGGAQVEALYLGAGDAAAGAGGLLATLASTTLIIDCSTIAPDSARRVAAAAAARGLVMLDAPVSGGTGGAQAGTLTFIVGGDAAAVARARPLLLDMGAAVLHAGPAGAGQVAKVCNNMLLAIQMAGTAEALALGVSNGLDPAVLSEIMQRSSGSNWPLTVYNPWPGVMEGVPAARNYAGGFVTDLMLKDLGLALGAAADSGASTPLGALARSLFELHRRTANAGRLDFSSIQRLYADVPDRS